MPCHMFGVLCTSSCSCRLSGGIANKMVVVVTAISASITMMTATKRGTRCFCSQTTIGFRTHREKKNQREQQDYRLQRAQDEPDDKNEKDQPNDAPRAIVTQRCVRVFAMCLVHNQGMMASQPSYAFLTTNEH
jgi:hypothetical protein